MLSMICPFSHSLTCAPASLQPRNAVDHVDRQIEAIDLIPNREVPAAC